MSSSDVLSSPLDASGFASVVGIDVGSQTCVYTVLQPDKRIIVKPTEVANRDTGFAQIHLSLSHLGVPPQRILIGLEATSRYSENLYHFLAAQGYVLCLLHPRQTHPRQTHQFAQQRGLRAKTDRLDAATIARVLLSGEARPGYVPDELITTYRELERLHSQLTDDGARYPSARALVEAGVEAVAATLREVAPRRYGRKTAQQGVWQGFLPETAI